MFILLVVVVRLSVLVQERLITKVSYNVLMER